MEQLLLHLVGDYLTQSHWMAQNKTEHTIPALVHATVYSLPFFLIASPIAVAIIWFTHLVIDRWRLARFVVFAKNFLAPRSHWHRWEDCNVTGYNHQEPVWLVVWLLIVADNVLHLLINYACIRWL